MNSGFGHTLQKLARYPAIINFVVKKANNNKSIQTLFSSMLNDMDLKKQLIKPSFYFRLFFSYPELCYLTWTFFIQPIFRSI